MSTHYDKLIRDRIPEIMEAAGKAFRVRTATPEEFESYAVRKLQEELDEFKASGDGDELADLLEVIYAVASIRGVDQQELERRRARKAVERGGFEKKLILIEAD